MTASEKYERKKIQRLIKRMKAEKDVHEAARLAEIAYRKIQNVRAMRQDDEEWISLENGTHILIEEESGKVVSGAGGALNGETLSAAQSTENEKKSSNENNGKGSRDRSRESAGENKTKPAGTVKFGGKSSAEFAEAVVQAKKTCDPKIAWRVTAHTQEDLDKYYKGAKLHVTEGGSTVAVAKDGDIISVCGNKNDAKMRGRDLMELAVDNGGIKLDSYDGNHGFYLNCGFEPVSWCKWSDEAAGEEWLEYNGLPKDTTPEELSKIPDSELKAPREDIVFYKYTGNKAHYNLKEGKKLLAEFKSTTPASVDYDAAQRERDNLVQGE